MLKSARYVVWNDYCAQTRDPCYDDIISHAQNASLDQLVIILDVGRVNNLCVLPRWRPSRRNEGHWYLCAWKSCESLLNNRNRLRWQTTGAQLPRTFVTGAHVKRPLVTHYISAMQIYTLKCNNWHHGTNQPHYCLVISTNIIYHSLIFLTKVLSLKPLHTIGKVSVNASIHKAITHYW